MRALRGRIGGFAPLRLRETAQQLLSSRRRPGPNPKSTLLEHAGPQQSPQLNSVVDGVDGPLRHQCARMRLLQISDKGAVRDEDYPHWYGYVEAYFCAAWG